MATRKKDAVPAAAENLPVAANAPAPLVALQKFAIAKVDPAEVSAVMAANMQGERLTRFDLPTIKIPAGGGIAWTVPTLAGPKPAEAIEGVVLLAQTNRAFWRVAFEESGGGSPPDCGSADGERGDGDPGGSCLNCPLSRFAPGEDRPACREGKILYMLRTDSRMPCVVALPATSLKAWKRYMMDLTDEGLPYFGVVTRLGLEQDRSKPGRATGRGGNVLYSKVKPGFSAKLDPADLAHIAPLREAVIAQFGQTLNLDAMREVNAAS